MTTRLACMLLLVALTGCKRFHAKAGESPFEVCSAANDGKTVSVAGYLVQPFFSLECQRDCFLWIAETAGEESGIYAKFTAGTGPNQVRPLRGHGSLAGSGATRLAKSEFHIRDESGKQSLGIDDTARITGILSTKIADGKLSCNLEVARVDAAE